jgi:cobalt-zinc-cadmium efflux system outer membrane protein
LSLLLLVSACTPEAYRGAPPPFFLQALPMEPRLGSDGELDRSRLELAGAVGAADTTGPIAVTVDQAMRVSVATHPRVRSMLETVVQARADHITASLLPNPSIGASYTLAPFPGQRFNATSRQGGPPQLDLGLGVLLDALLFGKRSAAIQAAELEVDVVLAQYADVGRRLLLGAIDSYYATLQARRLLALDRQEHEQLQRLAGILQRQVELGGATRIELDRTDTAVALAHRRVAQSAADFDNSMTTFRTYLAGVEGGDRAEPVDEAIPAPPGAVPALAQAKELAEQNRPDLVAARRELARARALVVREQANAWPWLKLSPGFTRQYQSKAIGFPDASSWGLGLDASLPLFDRNQGNIAFAESLLRQAELGLEALRIDVFAEVERAVRDHLAARAAAAIVDDNAVSAAERARQGVEAAHALGGRTLLEVLDARAACREVYREQIRAHAELLRTGHRLDAVVGTQLPR